MPVARIITSTPADCEELRRQLTAAGYSVKLAAPDEEFDDADIVVAAANVHTDYALQYASELAVEAGADVIVAPGVVAGSSVPAPRGEERIPAKPQYKSDAPATGVLLSTAQEFKSAIAEGGQSIRETLGGYTVRLRQGWESRKQQRAIDAEQKRLEREQREYERQQREFALRQQRAAAEAQMAAERERLRLQRAAEEQRLRREQEERRAALEAERARLAAEAERARAEQERVAREAAWVAQPTPAPAMPPEAPIAVAPVAAVPVTPPLPVARPRAPVRRAVPRPRATIRRTSRRDQRFQRAALFASVVALLAMLGFAIAMNIHPGAPIPHSMVQNPVQEKSPFGAASITPATSSAKPAPVQAVSHTALPQRDATPATTAKPSPGKKPAAARRRASNNYVAEDEVVIHHYGTTPAKHPPATQTRAGVPKYTDQD
jgi:hypothetical protein